MTFEDELKALVYFHLQEHTSAQHLLQVLEEDDFAREHIAPKKMELKSNVEAINHRGLEQSYVFSRLQIQVFGILPQNYSELGELVAIDGSLIDTVLLMTWLITEI
ncbi:MAG: hypothetical protein R2941_10980 [Desulfobacterales bacterium]